VRRSQKDLIVRFHTSNIDKFLQARLIFREAGRALRYFRESQDPYEEDYVHGKKGLLERAIREIVGRLGANSLFFVEDTSVRIEALSKEEDFPGLRVKEWFDTTTFDELNAHLEEAGDDRRATVFSDIALFVPGLGRPVAVGGKTRGSVALSAPRFAPNAEYPWLTPQTFNGWFIPEGATRRLGEMELEESLDHDFRARALRELLGRLDEFTAVLRLPTGSYVQPWPKVRMSQPTLFPSRPLLVVVGRVCAGKTTFGEYAARTNGSLHIEASGVMRGLAKTAGVSEATPAATARTLLSIMGPDVIAREIDDRFGETLDSGAVITGFRTLEEILYVRSRRPGCLVVLVDSGERIRFERNLARGRGSPAEGFKEFRALDREQWAFGLLRRVADVCDLRITNEGSMTEYERQIDAVLSGSHERGRGVQVRNRDSTVLRSSRLFRCLQALSQFEGPASCQDIASLTRRVGGGLREKEVETVSDRHVNWVLKDVPELARRVERGGRTVHYELLPAGGTYLEVVGRSTLDDEA